MRFHNNILSYIDVYLFLTQQLVGPADYNLVGNFTTSMHGRKHLGSLYNVLRATIVAIVVYICKVVTQVVKSHAYHCLIQ